MTVSQRKRLFPAGRGAAAAGFSRPHHEAAGAARSTAGRAYRAPQQQTTTPYPQITPLKRIQFLDAAVAASDSKPAAFPEKTMAAHTPAHTPFNMSSLVSQAVGATISLLRAHLRLVRVKVNQRRRLLLQFCEGDCICWWLPQPKGGMLEGSCCDAEKLQLRSGLRRARHHAQG